jgi:predicted nucleotide-binding protein
MNTDTGRIYYNVIVVSKAGGDVFVALDLTEPQLTDHVVAPFREGRTLLVGGAPLDVTDVKLVKIHRYHMPSSEIRRVMHSNRIDVAGRSGQLKDYTTAAQLAPTDVDVASAGTDVTNEYITQAPATAAAQIATKAKDPRAVFVVRGRNAEAHKALAEFLRALDLVPRDFGDFIRKGSPYVGEVLDLALAEAQAIVVLLTPDDVASLKPEFQKDDDPDYETKPTGQARPNVLFEAGMAMSKCPERTVLLQLGDIRPFSDIGGRHILRMDNSYDKRRDLANRLLHAGCDLKWNHADWHNAGDFESAVKDMLDHLFDE